MTGRRERARLRATARAILEAALEAVEPYRLVRRQLALGPGWIRVGGMRHRLGRGRVVVVAAGKAAAPMARAAEDALGDRLDGGLIVTASGSGRPGRLPLRVAGHPVPDARGLAAAAEIEALARGLRRDDLLIVLLSGGASALLPAPAAGISLRDKARATTLLLRSGASIPELNAVRKHLSRLKNGALARLARPARVATLLLSDVVGDDLSTIASGPTVPDATTYSDALAVLRRHALLERVPASVRERLERGARGLVQETPKPGDRAFRGGTVRIVGSNRLSVEAAAREARRRGLRPVVLTTRLEGEAREVARVLVSLLRERVGEGRSAGSVCLLAGGETTVTVRGDGRGGRNQELAVAAAGALAGFPAPAVVAALATDGIDGASDAAGGVVDDRTTSRAAALGLAPAATFLAASDSTGFLGPLGEQIVTGPTGTNVADVVVLLAGSPGKARL